MTTVRAVVALSALAAAANADAGKPSTTPAPPVGHYYGQTLDGSTALEVEADGRCRYSTQADGPAEQGTGRVISQADGSYRCRNAPGPVALDLAAPATRDPRVALTLDARKPDGWPAEGLALRLDGRSQPFDNGGRVVLLGDAKVAASDIAVIRLADGRLLWRSALKSAGPNRFLFTYRPSNVEPVDVRFRPLDPSASGLRIDVGPAGADLQRERLR